MFIPAAPEKVHFQENLTPPPFCKALHNHNQTFFSLSRFFDEVSPPPTSNLLPTPLHYNVRSNLHARYLQSSKAKKTTNNFIPTSSLKPLWHSIFIGKWLNYLINDVKIERGINIKIVTEKGPKTRFYPLLSISIFVVKLFSMQAEKPLKVKSKFTVFIHIY